MDTFDGFPPVRQHFAEKANACIPELQTVEQQPLGLVKAEEDTSALLGWKAVPDGPVESMKVLDAGDSIIVDFGTSLKDSTGYLTFKLQPYKRGLEPADSPCRLRIVFGEIPNDVAESLESYDAWLSKAWLPDEVINVDYLPQQVSIARRHAFRFVRFDIIATSQRYGVKTQNPLAHAISSAPTSNPRALTFTKANLSLTESDRAMLRKIDTAALLTLRNCMQTVYEDGPRRHMRLWIGDLRLQALINYLAFKDLKLAKRCLYLFAATPIRSDGLLSASCFEKPQICSGGQSIVDFSQIYAAALLDYVEASGDFDTGKELFEVAAKQFKISVSRCDPMTGLYVIPTPKEGDDPSGAGGEAWHIIDWQETLDKSTPSHCVVIFGLKSLLKLSSLISLPTPTIPTPFSPSPLPLPQLIAKLSESAQTHFYSSSISAYVSGPDQQLSWASNAWAVMAGIPPSTAMAAKALTVAYKSPDGVRANTPYLHHYLCEAFILAGMDDMAVKHILKYWGSMIDAGAETFWEAWVPERPRFSAYGDLHSNSFCHAWSCTPAFLLRKLGFQ